MKKKKSFWSIIARYAIALLLISSWAVLGVAIAINSAKVDIGGKVTFQATDVYADITGAITGTKTTNTLEDIHLDASTTSFTSPSSWKNLVFDFIKDTNNIVFTINVTNKSSERSLWVDFEDSISTTNVKITREVANTEVSAFSTTEVTALSSKAFEISMQVENLNKSASGDFTLALKLSNDKPALDESAYPTLSFTYNETAKTATVAQNSSNAPTGELVIPAKVMHNGEEYSVSVIGFAAFSACNSITSVYIPSSITIINSYAFTSCGNLTTINIPSSVIKIGKFAFEVCTKLTSATFETTIGWSVSSDSAGATPTISATDLSANANLLTNTYLNYDWTRA